MHAWTSAASFSEDRVKKSIKTNVIHCKKRVELTTNVKERGMSWAMWGCNDYGGMVNFIVIASRVTLSPNLQQFFVLFYTGCHASLIYHRIDFPYLRLMGGTTMTYIPRSMRSRIQFKSLRFLGFELQEKHNYW